MVEEGSLGRQVDAEGAAHLVWRPGFDVAEGDDLALRWRERGQRRLGDAAHVTGE
jgi:hypothetical protein